MLLLRNGGEFIERRIEQHGWLVLRHVALGTAVFTGLALTISPLLGLIGGAIVVAGAKADFKRWGNWQAGKVGELAVTEVLKALPNQYIVLNDLMLPEGRGNVDHLVIGPNGIFVIETKNYSGYVSCWGDRWYVNRREISSLSKQAKRNALAIKNSLDGVFREHHARIPWVDPILAFTNPAGRLKIKSPTIPVLRSAELPAFISRYRAASSQPIATPELNRAIVHHLHVLQQKPEKSAVSTVSSSSSLNF